MGQYVLYNNVEHSGMIYLLRGNITVIGYA